MDKSAYVLSVFERLRRQSPILGHYADDLKAGKMTAPEIERCYEAVVSVMEALTSENVSKRAAAIAGMLAQIRDRERSESAAERSEKLLDTFF